MALKPSHHGTFVVYEGETRLGRQDVLLGCNHVNVTVSDNSLVRACASARETDECNKATPTHWTMTVLCKDHPVNKSIRPLTLEYVLERLKYSPEP